MMTTEEMENATEAALVCPRCDGANARGRKFCVQCGTPLWEPCLRCGESCAACEEYCGSCGACLDEVAAERLEQLTADFHVAVEMESAFRFQEALALLAAIAKNDHPRLAAHTARAKDRIDQLTVQRRRHRIAADEARQGAKQCLADHDYDGAAAYIENVPPALQDDELRQLLAHIEDRRREIVALDEELRRAVKQKRLLDLPPCLDRLLALKPDHAYANKVSVQVRQRLVDAARKLTAEHRYDRALQLLDQISSTTDAADFQQIRRQATELSWLAWDLRNAPVVDDALAAVAARLRRLAPQDAENIRLCDELQRRIRLAGAGQRQEPIRWASPPEQTPLGVPVEWLTGFRRVACAETMDRSALLAHPGRFAIACGLALAGVKQAAMRINLLTNKQQGVLHRMANLMQTQSTRPAWGIDLGASGLKAVKLAWNEAKHQAVIEAATFIEHAKPLSHAANEAEESKVVEETLKKFLGAHKIKTERVCLGLPGRMTLSRQIKVPPADSSKAAKLVQFEAAQQFPFPLEQLNWDFQFLDSADGRNGEAKTSGEKGRRALLIAAKRAATETYLNAFRRLGMRIDVLHADFMALHNFLAHDYFAPVGDPASGESRSAVAALDIGGDVTNIVVSSPHSLWVRNCGVAGHTFTRALVKEYNLSIAQAEQRKRSPESAERLGELFNVLSPVFDDLLSEVQQSLAMYAKAWPEHPVERVLGLGGGFSMHGLFRHLRCGR